MGGNGGNGGTGTVGGGRRRTAVSRESITAPIGNATGGTAGNGGNGGSAAGG